MFGQFVENLGDGGDLIGLFGNPQLRQGQSGIGGVGTQRMQGFEAFALVVGSARSFAIDGNELVAVRPERCDPAFETTTKQDGVDPVEESAHPALTGDAVMELAKASQKIDMVFAPSHDIVEIVTGGDCRTGDQQHHLLERIHDPPGTSSSRIVAVRAMIALRAESERPQNHSPRVNTKLPRLAR